MFHCLMCVRTAGSPSVDAPVTVARAGTAPRPVVSDERGLEDAAVPACQVQRVLRGVRGHGVQRRRQAQGPQQRACGRGMGKAY